MTALSYRLDHTPSTNSSSAVCVPTAGAAFLLTGMLFASIPHESAALQRNDRYAAPLNGTYSPLQNAFTGEYAKHSDLDFEGTVAAFYATLLGRQEPLGAEFEKILYDNLWELYGD